MTRMWIVVGDMTSSGGRVIDGSPFTSVDGKPVARVGNMAICPLHKGAFPIVDDHKRCLFELLTTSTAGPQVNRAPLRHGIAILAPVYR